MTTHLDLSWSVSRGRDTYGFNICRLDDTSTGKRYRCMGGGYDMAGSVFGEWLQENFQQRLMEMADETYYRYHDGGPGVSVNEGGAYGSYGYFDADGAAQRVRLDGGCGLESMTRIAKSIGLDVQRLHSRKGETTGWIVTDRRAS